MKQSQSLPRKQEIETLLDNQTKIILSAVDEKMGRLEKSVDTKLGRLEKSVDTKLGILEKSVDTKLGILEIRLLSAMEKKILASEERMNRKLDKLITTLDKFLKRLTDIEDEFTIMKHDINRLKKVIQEKLGVNLS